MLLEVDSFNDYPQLAGSLLEVSKKARRDLSKKLILHMLAADVAARKELTDVVKKRIREKKKKIRLADPEFEEAIREYLGKVTVTSEQMQRLETKYKRLVWGTKTLMGVSDSIQYTILERGRELIEDAMNNGTSYAQFSEQLKQEGADILPEYRLKLIFHQNIIQAYNSGAWQQLYEASDENYQLVFKTADDERTDEDCSKFDGFVAEKNDPIWQTLYPPVHFNCRCLVRMALDEDLANAKTDVSVSSIPEDFRSWPGDGFTLSVPTAEELRNAEDFFAELRKVKGEN